MAIHREVAEIPSFSSLNICFNECQLMDMQGSILDQQFWCPSRRLLLQVNKWTFVCLSDEWVHVTERLFFLFEGPKFVLFDSLHNSFPEDFYYSNKINQFTLMINRTINIFYCGITRLWSQSFIQSIIQIFGYRWYYELSGCVNKMNTSPFIKTISK